MTFSFVHLSDSHFDAAKKKGALISNKTSEKKWNVRNKPALFILFILNEIANEFFINNN